MVTRPISLQLVVSGDGGDDRVDILIVGDVCRITEEFGVLLIRSDFGLGAG